MITSRSLQQMMIAGFGLACAFALGPILVRGVGDTLFRSLLLATSAVFIVFRPRLGVYLVLFLSPLKAFDFGSGLVSLTRIVGLGTLLIMLIHFAVRRRDFQWTGIEGPVFLMGLGMSLSFFRTSRTDAVALDILALFSLYGLTFLITNLVKDEAQLRELTLVFLTSAAYPVGLAIAQWVQSPYRWTRIARVSSTFTSPTGLGAFTIPIVLMAFPLIFYPGFSRLVRLLVISVFTAGVLALIMSFSRSPWIGVLIGFAVFFPLLLSRVLVGRRVVVILSFALLGGVVWYFWPLIDARFVTPIVDLFTTGISIKSVLVRRYELLSGPQIILNNYFLGTGIGNYQEDIMEFRRLYGISYLAPSPHNIFFYFFGEVGIVGATGFIWLLVRLFQQIRSFHRRVVIRVSDLTSYVYMGSVASLLGLASYMFFHAGFFTNELWIVIAFLILATRMGTMKLSRPELEYSGQVTP